MEDMDGGELDCFCADGVQSIGLRMHGTLKGPT